MKSNKETWAAYQETDEDKKVYPEKQKKPSATSLTASLKTAFQQLVIDKMESSSSQDKMTPMSATLKEGKTKANFSETADAVLDGK